MTATLTKPGAAKLDTTLHQNVLKSGQAIGSFTVKVSNTPIAGPGSGSGSGVTPTSSSGVGIALTPDFRSLLDSVGLSTLPLVPASGTEGSNLSFSVNGGPELKLFDIDTSQLEQAATPNGSLDLTGLLATLSSEGASTLNTVVGQNAFTTGQPVGGVTLILPAAAAGS